MPNAIASTRPTHGSLNWDATIEADLAALDGALGTWIAFNPIFTNAAGLSATGEYVKVGHHIHFTGTATFGGSAAVGGQISMNTPGSRRTYSTLVSGRVLGVDTGIGYYDMVAMTNGASSVSFVARPPTTSMLVPTSSSVPFSWGNGDQILWDLWYAVD